MLKISGIHGSGLLPAGEIYFKDIDKAFTVYEAEDQPVKRRLPVTVGTVNKQFIASQTTGAWKLFVLKANQWKVWGNQGAVITDKNYLFRDVSREFYDKVHSVFNQFKLIKPTFLKGSTAVLAASGSTVYYHWMCDILPRIEILKRGGLFDQTQQFILNFQPNRYQEETLARAGIPQSKIISSNNHWNFYIQAEELVIPSLVSPNDCTSLWACNYLRSLYADEINGQSAGTEKLYIQRLNGRTVINEPALIANLAALDFRVINAEKLTVAEQAAVFAAAKIVIGPHGAGLTNIVFCRPGTIVIDLFSPKWVNPCYWVIAEHLNLRYGYLEGENIKKENKAPKGANILIDINKLKALMKKLEA